MIATKLRQQLPGTTLARFSSGLLVAALFVTACGGSSVLEDASSEDVPRQIQEDVPSESVVSSLASQPFNSLPRDEVRSAYRLLAIFKARCMESKGFPQFADNPIPDNVAIPLDHAVITDSYFGPASERQARLHGFGPEDLNAVAPVSIVANDRAFEAALTECENARNKEIGHGVVDAVTSFTFVAEDVGNRLKYALFDHPQLLDAASERQACLEDLGYTFVEGQDTVLIRGPRAEQTTTPFGEVRETSPGGTPAFAEGTVEVIHPPTLEYHPTPEETRMAVDDWSCRQKIGFGDRATAVVLEIQTGLIGSIEPQIEELRIILEKTIEEATLLLDAEN